MVLLGNEGSDRVCSIISREGGVRALLQLCRQHHNNARPAYDRFSPQEVSETRILALRGLSSVCCVAECIREFEKVR